MARRLIGDNCAIFANHAQVGFVSPTLNSFAIESRKVARRSSEFLRHFCGIVKIAMEGRNPPC